VKLIAFQSVPRAERFLTKIRNVFSVIEHKCCYQVTLLQTLKRIRHVHI